MFQKVLIANRGEVALRVIRACREAGARAVAVFSEADRGALHTRMADEAHPIGPASPSKSYLSAERIIAAARAAGAEAVHPGYGFLSEQASFAAACEAAGLVFIGPAPETLETAGDKIASRLAAEGAEVPLIPGAVPGGDDAGLWREAAEVLGYPVFVKAAAGGGGRGMRSVDSAASLDAALSSAGAEALSAFGDGRLYLEKRLAGVRHVEVQIAGDGKGGAVHLGERECSVQRRHQKVFEESPAPALETPLRLRLRDAAVRLAESLDYRGVGTVEFLVQGESEFSFLEINARLQVEHPVTEMVTGLDIVKLQLLIAAGEDSLPAQEEVSFSGHAIEARLYAEDPARGFMPQTGTVRALELPEGEGLRVDAGIEKGSVVGADYDPLLAKVIAWGADRKSALERLCAALKGLRLAGLRTNQALLACVASHPAFQDGGHTTDFLSQHPDVLSGGIPEERDEDARLSAALGLYLMENARARGGAIRSAPAHDPWRSLSGWYPGGAA